LTLAQEEKRREKEAEAAAAAAAEAAKQQQAAGASEAGGGANSKGGKKKGSSRPPDPDPEGAKLAATTDPLGEATKFVVMLKQVGLLCCGGVQCRTWGYLLWQGWCWR
jgi:peptide alpha-N-acetyltransferase